MTKSAAVSWADNMQLPPFAQAAISIALVGSHIAGPANAAEFHCRFDLMCLTQNLAVCQDVAGQLLIRTPPDSVVSGFSDADDGFSFLGDTDLFGTPGILPGQIVSAVARMSFPDSFRTADKQINMAERITDVTEGPNFALHVTGPNIYVSPSEALSTPYLELEVVQDMSAKFSVSGRLRIDQTFHGKCEAL